MFREPFTVEEIRKEGRYQGDPRPEGVFVRNSPPLGRPKPRIYTEMR